MDLEIESLLFKQVEKPKNHFLTKIHNVWENRYRINIYTETFDNADKLFKRKISYLINMASTTYMQRLERS